MVNLDEIEEEVVVKEDDTQPEVMVCLGGEIVAAGRLSHPIPTNEAGNGFVIVTLKESGHKTSLSVSPIPSGWPKHCGTIMNRYIDTNGFIERQVATCRVCGHEDTVYI